VQAAAAANVTTIIKTTRLYGDLNTLFSTYALVDAVGRCTVATAGLVVSGAVATSSGFTGVAACTAPSAAGVGTCSFSAPGTWFVAAATGTVVVTAAYSGTVTATAPVAAFNLTAAPTAPTIASVGVVSGYITLPHSPRYAGDTISSAHRHLHGRQPADLVAGVGDVQRRSAQLRGWLAAAPLFNSPASSASSGFVSVAATGIKGTTTPASVTGTVAAALTLTFTVLASAPTGLCAACMSGMVGSLVNQGTITFLTNKPMPLFDDRSGWTSGSGQLYVAPVSLVGLYAYPSSLTSEWVNTAPLTGTNLSSALSRVRRVRHTSCDARRRAW
jgi:hypothetical protein